MAMTESGRTGAGAVKRTAAASALALALAVALGGCGPFMVVRQGSKMFNEISERNKTLAQQKEKMLAQLSPELEATCRSRASQAPARRSLSGSPVVAFDTSDDELVVPSSVTGQLNIQRARWAALKYDRPVDAEYLVFWQRQVTRSEPLLTLEEHTLRAEDKAGHAVASDTQFALHWQGAMRPEYLRCATVLSGGEHHLQTTPSPDFGALFELFGRRS